MRDTVLFNRAFGESMGNPQLAEKISAANARLIEDHLKVSAFAPEWLGRETITPDDPNLIPSLDQDTLEYRIELRPGARAAAVTFTGRDGGELIQAKRLSIPLFSVATPKFTVTQERLWAYRQNILDYLKDRAEVAIGDVSDLIVLGYAESMIRAMQTDGHLVADVPTNAAFNTSALGTVPETSIVKGENARNLGTDNFVVLNLEREDIVRALNLRGSDYRLQMSKAIMTENDVRTLGLLQNFEMGDEIASVTRKGWIENQFMGIKIITTLKGDILRRGNAYFTGEKEYTGVFVEVMGTQFWGRKEGNKLFFQMWKVEGAGFLHSHGVVKLELYSGSTNTTGTSESQLCDTGYAVAIPKPEDQLGSLVNKAPSGIYAPVTEMA